MEDSSDERYSKQLSELQGWYILYLPKLYALMKYERC
jgi:hypothetical protein